MIASTIKEAQVLCHTILIDPRMCRVSTTVSRIALCEHARTLRRLTHPCEHLIKSTITICLRLRLHNLLYMFKL